MPIGPPEEDVEDYGDPVIFQESCDIVPGLYVAEEEGRDECQPDDAHYQEKEGIVDRRLFLGCLKVKL